MERSQAKSCGRPHSFRTGKGQGRQPMRGGEITAVFAEGARKISEEPHSGFETTVEMGTSRRRLWRDERIFQRRLCLRLSASHHGRCQVTSWHTAEAATASSHGSGKAVASRPCGNELNLNTARRDNDVCASSTLQSQPLTFASRSAAASRDQSTWQTAARTRHGWLWAPLEASVTSS